MALTEHLFRRAAGDRRVTFDAIAAFVRLPRDEVWWWRVLNEKAYCGS